MGTITSTYTRGPMMPLDGARKEELRAALDIMEVAMLRPERADEDEAAPEPAASPSRR